MTVKNPAFKNCQRLANQAGEIKWVVAFFAALLIIYGTWLLVFWPGILGPDSLAILLQIQTPETFSSGKTAFWYSYVRLLYEHYQLVELPIGFIVILSAFMMARILGWCWSQRLFKTTIFLILFICIAPHLIFYTETLYADGIFAIASASLLFEVWIISYYRRTSCLSLINLAVAFSFALFVRSNGIVFLIPVAALIFMVNRASRIWIGAIIMGWCSIAALVAHYDKHSHHKAIYPMAIYETINFLQPRPMSLSWTGEPRVSPASIEALTRNHPLELYISHYDPDYWDPLNFDPTGPAVTALPQDDQNVITKEFFRYNLWHNFPKFMGSRVNIFLVAAFAQGGILGTNYSKFVLPLVKTKSVYRKFNLDNAERWLSKIHDHDYKYRWLLWTPFLGMALMVWVFVMGIRERDVTCLLVSIPMIAQLAGIFIFSIAGEYRYLLHFFTLPLALLPLIVTRRLDGAQNGAVANGP